MASPAQISANQKNAAASTGPRTPAGKSRSSSNALTLGLFTLRNVVQPGEEEEYASLTGALWNELAPEGPLEQSLAAEIMRATWRLQRCANLEARLGDSVPAFEADLYTCDPMAYPATAQTQAAVDRARLQTHRILYRSMAELRRIQSERQFRREILPETVDTANLGLASYVELMRPLAAEARSKRLNQQIDRLEPTQSVISDQPHAAPNTNPAKRTQFDPAVALTPRNAACPCGSGHKFKRCCGPRSEPVLYRAA